MTNHPWTSVSSRFIHSTLKYEHEALNIEKLDNLHTSLDINSSNVGDGMWLVMLRVLDLNNLLKMLSMILILATSLMMILASLTVR